MSTEEGKARLLLYQCTSEFNILWISCDWYKPDGSSSLCTPKALSANPKACSKFSFGGFDRRFWYMNKFGLQNKDNSS